MTVLHVVFIMPRPFLSLKVDLIAPRSRREKKMWNLFKVPAPNCECFFEYETPKVITVKNVPMGIFRIIVQGAILTFLFGFQLWYSRGYQSFADVEASITTKIKGRTT